MKTGFISVRAIIDDYLSFTGETDAFDEEILIGFANDAVSRIVTDEQYVQSVDLIRVENYKAELPYNFKYVCQAAYSGSVNMKSYWKKEISQVTQKALGTGCELEINLKCPSCHQLPKSCNCKSSNVVEVDVNRIWSNANPQHQVGYMKHFYNYYSTSEGNLSPYNEDFRLMKRKSNEFFGTNQAQQDFHIPGCLNLGLESSVEYDIQLPNMVLNFEKGYVLLSYLGSKTDEDGYLMIPDTPVVFEAVNRFIEERVAYKRYRSSRQAQDERFWKNSFELREKFISRANSELQIPDPDEFLRFVTLHWKTSVPYYSWWANLNKSDRNISTRPRMGYSHGIN